MQIKHRFTNAVLCDYDLPTIKDTLVKAVSEGANLEGANLEGANLEGANLEGANLRGANLEGANLRGANLREANLREADLYGANLRGANLEGANLRGANLEGANLEGANLEGANLRGADLYGANLREADLYGANLRGANLYGANLREAKNAELIIAQQSILPEGDIIGWKKLKNGVIAKLRIPSAAMRVNAQGSRKCRAEFVEVLELSSGTSCFDKHTGKLEYTVGAIVTPDSFDDNNQVECANGIHFFITKIEAENY